MILILLDFKNNHELKGHSWSLDLKGRSKATPTYYQT